MLQEHTATPERSPRKIRIRVVQTRGAAHQPSESTSRWIEVGGNVRGYPAGDHQELAANWLRFDHGLCVLFLFTMILMPAERWTRSYHLDQCESAGRASASI